MSGAGGTALAFEAAAVGYGDRTVVHGVSFEVRAGEFVGLVGPNGAGKSTLLRAVTGGADIGEGDITSEGASLLRMPDRDRARLVGVVPQSAVALFAFTARAFVEMGRHPHLGRLAALGQEDDAVVDGVMERTDTSRLAAERVDELSGGDLQRLTLAQALAQQPRVLLLDEPTSHLDLNHALQVLDLVRSLADGGMAVLGVFHDLGIAARYADRIAIVADGRVTPPVPPAEALSARVVSDVFGVRAVVRTDPVTGSVAVTPVLRGEDLERHAELGTVGLVCGSGAGASLMRQLMLAGYGVAAGALNRGDVDQSVAEALGAGYVPLPPFDEVGPVASAEVAGSFASAACVVVCPTPFGRSNLPNLQAAIDSGRPLVLMGDMDAERDFTGGEATKLWAEALAAGAERVETEAEALEVVGRHGGAERR
ncbi:MAG: ABC transporter ATP-binding protein [Coriobacteriia bacterium]|nr:ABC transporter ATP-binding protein [Coriobacteriia bacterium]